MLQSAKENHITEARKHFVCAIFRTEFTFGKILEPLNIDMQKVIEMHHHNQFVYVINVMDGMFVKYITQPAQTHDTKYSGN